VREAAGVAAVLAERHALEAEVVPIYLMPALTVGRQIADRHPLTRRIVRGSLVR
jgi:hypothetical protein